LTYFFFHEDLPFILLLLWYKLFQNTISRHSSDVNQGSVCQPWFFVISLKIGDTQQWLVLAPENSGVPETVCSPPISPLLICFLTLLQSLFTNFSLVLDSPPFTLPHALCISKGGENNIFLSPLRWKVQNHQSQYVRSCNRHQTFVEMFQVKEFKKKAI
jgi:hypothetical protein